MMKAMVDFGSAFNDSKSLCTLLVPAPPKFGGRISTKDLFNAANPFSPARRWNHALTKKYVYLKVS
jgi:hypothetical protein